MILPSTHSPDKGIGRIPKPDKLCGSDVIYFSHRLIAGGSKNDAVCHVGNIYYCCSGIRPPWPYYNRWAQLTVTPVAEEVPTRPVDHRWPDYGDGELALFVIVERQLLALQLGVVIKGIIFEGSKLGGCGLIGRRLSIRGFT